MVDGGGELGVRCGRRGAGARGAGRAMHAVTVTVEVAVPVATLRLLVTVTSPDTPRPAETTSAEPQSTYELRKVGQDCNRVTPGRQCLTAWTHSCFGQSRDRSRSASSGPRNRGGAESTAIAKMVDIRHVRARCE